MFVSSNTIINNRRQRKPYIYSNYVTQCYYIVIFTFVRWALYKTNCGSFCMNRTTFRDPWPGGVLVKNMYYCASSIYALWICRVTNRVHIAWTQTGRHSILKYHFIVYSYVYDSERLHTEPSPQYLKVCKSRYFMLNSVPMKGNVLEFINHQTKGLFLFFFVIDI